MWSPASSEPERRRHHAPGRYAPGAQVRAAITAGTTAVLTLGFLAACSSTPLYVKEPAPAAAPPAATPAKAGSAAPGSPSAAGTSAGGTAAGAAHPAVPAAAVSDFSRALKYMRAGNETEAELGFKQVALTYPQFAAPLVNLAILQRKNGHLDEAEKTLKDAVARESGSAVAWTELGATQRMRGGFKDAASSYEQAIAADPRYAPAWRNLGVVSDLYLGDPNRALKAFEQYKELTGEDKPVSGWIAELRQRLGMPPLKRPGSAEPAQGSPGTPPDTPAQGTPAAPAAAPAQAPRGAPSATPPATPTPQPKPGGSPANVAAPSGAPSTGG
jgi:tetratricopeptide (TPR) repeat protein